MPSFVTLNFDFLPGNSFQPVRSLPLNSDFRAFRLQLDVAEDDAVAGEGDAAALARLRLVAPHGSGGGARVIRRRAGSVGGRLKAAAPDLQFGGRPAGEEGREIELAVGVGLAVGVAGEQDERLAVRLPLEIEHQLVIAEGAGGDEQAWLLGLRGEHSVEDGPLRVVGRAPAVSGFAVPEQNPPVFDLFLCQRVGFRASAAAADAARPRTSERESRRRMIGDSFG